MLSVLPETDEGLIISVDDVKKAKVLSVGPGMPYGRGEYYSLMCEPGDVVLVKESVLKASDRVRKDTSTFYFVKESDLICIESKSEPAKTWPDHDIPKREGE